MTFNYIELFAGIGGFRQALDKLGGQCVFASEIDKFAVKSYEALYGDTPAGDITQIDASEIPDHDVLVGGFPCQAFSVAGQRKGFEDTRGTLFFEIARIAAEKRPRLMLLENVKGLLSHDKGRTFEVMCAVLNDLGYAIDFNVLNSKYFGVPQNRERVFIIASRDAEHSEWNVTGTGVVAKAKRRIAALGVRTFNFDWPANAEVTAKLRDILETDVDEKYYLSDDKTANLVAQLEAKDPDERMSQQAIETYNSSSLPKEHGDIIHAFKRQHDKSGVCPTLTTRPEGFKTAALPIVEDPIMLGHIDLKGHDAIKRVYSAESVGPTLTTMGGGHREPKIAEPQLEQYSEGAGLAYTVDANYMKGTSPGDIGKGRRTHVVEYSRKDGVRRELDVAHTLNSSDWRGLNRNQAQNAVLEEIRPVPTPDREEKRQNGRRFKEDGEESFTLTAQDRHGVAIGVSPRYRIRKLTPRECWRLQGFSDTAFNRAKSAGVSDSQLYKQAGNAVTVNVIEAIGEKLIRLLSKKSTILERR